VATAFTGPVTDQQVAARHFFQEKGEIFAAGQGLALTGHAPGADQFLGHVAREVGLAQVVDQHRVAPLVVDLCPYPVALGLGLGQFGDAFFQQFTHLRIQGTHAQAERGFLRNHIVGHAGVERAHRDDSRLLWIDVAGHDALQAQHDGRASHHRVGRLVWHGPVAALAIECDGDVIG